MLKTLSNLKGFTLAELLVVIMILAVLFSFLLLLLNPFKQIQRAQDARRESDLKQTVQALDTYYNDNNCYPTSLSFGSSWLPYINPIPQDPTFSSGGPSYVYVTGTNCPQWNVLFAKLGVKPVSTSSSCPLESIPDCLPQNYASTGYNFCLLSGKVDCAVIKNVSFSAPTQAPQPTNTPIPTSPPVTTTNTPIPSATPTLTPVATPTLIPGGCYCSNAQYDLRPLCNHVGLGANPPARYCDTQCTIPCQ